MKILLLEYITAGGFNDAPLPASLLREGTLMRDALLRDFSAVAQVELTTTYDARVGKPTLQTQHTIYSHEIHANINPIEMWQTLLSSCDAALIVAPETNGVLHQLTQLVEATTVSNLGCDAASVKLTASKLATCAALQQAGITTIPSYSAHAFDVTLAADRFPNGYVVKPDDGAGCDDTWYFENSGMLNHWLQNHADALSEFIIQPYQTGLAVSFSMLCKQGKAWLLACNTQNVSKAINQENNIDRQPQQFKYTGSCVNALAAHYADFNALATHIAAAIPGLNGYVGVDVIIEGGAIFVVEINPRITTSYIGLQQSLQYNPAELILKLADEGFALPANLTAHAVEVNLDA